jgi:hypothetical protein
MSLASVPARTIVQLVLQNAPTDKTDLKEKESPVEVHTYGETTSYTLYKGRNMWTWGDGSVFGDF